MNRAPELSNEDLVRTIIDGDKAVTSRREYLEWSFRCLFYAICDDDWDSFSDWHNKYKNNLEVVKLIEDLSVEELQEELDARKRRAFLEDNSLELEKTINRVVLSTSGDIQKHFKKVGFGIIRHS